MKTIFNYNQNQITFHVGNGDVMVNATEMIKVFPTKRMSDFTNNQQSCAFIQLLEGKTGNPVLTVNHGGSNPGTWMHQKLALKFAAWLSPEFELWVYDRIEELLKFGATAINPEDLLNPDFIIRLATELKEERAQKEMLRLQTEKQAEELKKAAPKVQYHDQVLNSDGLISVTEMANMLGFRSAKALNSFLKIKGIIRRVNNTWALTARYSGYGLAKYKTFTYLDSEGKDQTSHHLYFTEKGKQFFIDYVKKVNQKA